MKTALAILMLSLFLSLGANHAKAASPSQNHRTLRVGTYNIRGLPVWINGLTGWSGEKRFAKIAKYFQDRLQDGTAPDFLVFEEVISERARAYVHSIGYPYFAEGPGRGGKTYPSGVIILSQHPILNSARISYGDVTGAIEGGLRSASSKFIENRMNKGMVAIETRIEGTPQNIILAGTHMVAQEELDAARVEGAKTIRAQLLPQMDFKSLTSLWAGDFNTKPKRPSYQELIKQMAAAGVNLVDAGKFCEDQPDHCARKYSGEKYDANSIYRNTPDRQFVSTPESSAYTLKVNSVKILLGDKVNKDNKQALSDHPLYEVEYDLSW
jgi:endonuclease/exonuclease/phosphatase family metal-dependent hydrolase